MKYSIISLLALAGITSGFAPLSSPSSTTRANTCLSAERNIVSEASSALATLTLSTLLLLNPLPSDIAHAAEGGASNTANSKIATGGASTLQSGRTIAITRGVNLDRSDFSNQNLKGVAFQQSIVRDANFKGSNLMGASFFDATIDGSNFEDSDMTQVNLEMAQLSRANLKNAVVREMYVGGATIFDGIKDIENTDWTGKLIASFYFLMNLTTCS